MSAMLCGNANNFCDWTCTRFLVNQRTLMLILLFFAVCALVWRTTTLTIIPLTHWYEDPIYVPFFLSVSRCTFNWPSYPLFSSTLIRTPTHLFVVSFITIKLLNACIPVMFMLHLFFPIVPRCQSVNEGKRSKLDLILHFLNYSVV